MSRFVDLFIMNYNYINHEVIESVISSEFDGTYYYISADDQEVYNLPDKVHKASEYKIISHNDSSVLLTSHLKYKMWNRQYMYNHASGMISKVCDSIIDNEPDPITRSDESWHKLKELRSLSQQYRYKRDTYDEYYKEGRVYNESGQYI